MSQEASETTGIWERHPEQALPHVPQMDPTPLMPRSQTSSLRYCETVLVKLSISGCLSQQPQGPNTAI